MIINGREIRVAAIDFDGTLFTEDRFPEVGDPIHENIEYVKLLQKNGIELILWTNREGALLEDALSACKSVGLKFDAVNENLQWRIDLYGNDCRKIGADLYLDDKSLNLSPTASHKDIDQKICSIYEYEDSYHKNPYFKIIIDKILNEGMPVLSAIKYLCNLLEERDS